MDDRWTLVYEGFDTADEGLRETLCTLGNGYFATRGAAPESEADGVHYPGTYVAGCYDRLTTEIAGHRVDNADLVNLPNWLPLTFRAAGGDWFDIDRAARRDGLLDYRQELDLHRGVLTRLFRYRDHDDRTFRVAQRRIVSMAEPHLGALETTIVCENWTGTLEVRSAVDGRIVNAGVARYRGLRGDHLVCEAPRPHDAADPAVVTATTRSSRIGIAVAARTRLSCPGTSSTHDEADRAVRTVHVAAREGVPVTIEKIAAVYTSRDRALEEYGEAAHEHAAHAPGFDDLLERHTQAWAHLWRRCRLSVDDTEVQRILNLHVFHLLQTVSEHTVDLDVGVPARGLHGEAYRGHVFWDELFILPFLSTRFPEIARALLMYRRRRLPAARRNAAATGHKGALYPWQSAADGREETQTLHLNPRSGRWLPDHSHLQRHSGLAVAYNAWRFYESTGDLEFLAEYGAEMMLEVARYFADIATYDRSRDRYDIRGVMGPDEYHDGYPGRERPGIDNNAYTNVLTAWVLRRTLDALALLPENRDAELRGRLALTQTETARFADVAAKLRVPFHDGVISQFEGYENLDELDWDRYKARYGDIRRIDRILEAEGDSPNRYKASKQADILMLFYLLAPHEFDDVLLQLGYDLDPALPQRTIDYYLERTCDGSTLSMLVRAWILARTDGDLAWHAFLDALHSDIGDSQHGTTAEGIHLGAMAGTVDLVQRCFAGISTRDETLHLSPHLPAALTRLHVDFRYRGHWGIDLSLQPDRLRVALRPGSAPPITVACGTETAVVEPGTSWETPLAGEAGIDGRRSRRTETDVHREPRPRHRG
ncbi:glycoside hydrolase family 65 protein [Actinomadura sp. WMMB 499]|uniref:glycoside hydrolase family 65 protein n=1 Tax=Actinomadura sp. WMMB 499 TaxID=1219491 RepID=UPI001245392C|nr:glycosyl hydrolase family 65 protein [Actinomadura sp. WMMB 499]QFG21282.1 glycoside hydrolase family 65 protein [Actinomadura sp. WMMB 499]